MNQMASKNFKVKEGLDVGGTVTATGINAPILAEAQITGATDTIYYASTKYIADFGADANEEGIRYMTAAGDNRFAVGDVVSVTGMNIAAANVTNKTIVSVSGQEITVFVGAGNTIPRGTSAYNASGQTPTMTRAASTYLTPGIAGQVLKSTGTGTEWGVAGDPYKEVFFLNTSSSGVDKWSADGITWVDTASSNISVSFPQTQKVATSGSRTVVCGTYSNFTQDPNIVLEVWDNYWSQTTATTVLTKTGVQLNSDYPGIENEAIGSWSPIMEGVASDGNGTFVITFTRSTKFLVSTDSGSTWATVEIPAPPSGEGEGGEGGQSPYWNAPTYQFGKFYVTAFGYNGFVESVDGLNWTVVPVSGMNYSVYPQVYVDASGSILAAYDQAMGLIYMSTSNNQNYYGVAYNNDLQSADPYSLKVVGGSLYFYAFGRVNSASIKYLDRSARTVYTSTELGSQSYNFVTATKNAALYGSYNFATNNHKIGQIGKHGASWPVGTGLHGQQDMFGHPGSLMVPIEVYNKYVGE